MSIRSKATAFTYTPSRLPTLLTPHNVTPRLTNPFKTPIPFITPKRPRHTSPTHMTTTDPPPTLKTLSKALQTKSLTSHQLLQTTLTKIHTHDPKLNTFLTLNTTQATTQSQSHHPTPSKPLSGIPLAIKDNILTHNIPTTASSKILENYLPPYSATVIERLEQAGMIILGKTNMDEFGMGSSTENSAYGVTRNPWDMNRVPGGSSGGSAGAVAAGFVSVALGSDTGGSVRLPAAFCGVSGLKPSYGRVSRYGLISYASSLDCVGVLGGCVEDLGTVLEVIAGRDLRDGSCVREMVEDYGVVVKGGEGKGGLKGVRVGVIGECMGGGVDGEVREGVRMGIEVLEELGAEVKEVSLEGLEAATAAYYVIATSEASANLARYDGVRFGVRAGDVESMKEMYTRSRMEGFGEEVKRRIMLGTFALSSGYYDEYYTRAQKVRAVMAKRFKDLFASGIDVLVSPVAPTPAFRIGEMSTDPTAMYLVDIMTIPASIAGLPALSIPCGHSRQGLPIGMQIVGPYLKEGLVMKVGHAFQCATDYHLKRPNLSQVASMAIA